MNEYIDVPSKLLPLVWIYGILCIVMVAAAWRTKLGTVGLPVAYMVDLTLVHYPGAFVYLKEDYYPHSATLEQYFEPLHTYLGFYQTTIGLFAIFLGSVVVAPQILRKTTFHIPKAITYQPNLNLPKVYIVIALIFNFVLGPFIKKIPSIGTMAQSGWLLLVAGLNLFIWLAILKRNKKKIFTTLLTAVLFLPTVTLLGGFLGFGARALSIVLVFVMLFYKPRWHIIVGAVVTIYLGMSFFYNYIEGRDEFRSVMWHGEGSKLGGLTSIFKDWKWFDPKEDEHLTYVDARLNQNDIAGTCVDFLDSGHVEFAKGETMWLGVIAIIPRIVWKNKPIMGGSGDLASKYTGRTYAEGTSIGIGQVAEFYVNFGTAGVFFCYFILGILIAIFDVGAAQRLKVHNWSGFVFWYVPGTGFLQAIGSVAEMSSTIISAIIFCVLINKYVLPRFKEKKMLDLNMIKMPTQGLGQ